MYYEAKHFPCPSCGAFQQFSPTVGQLVCGFCGTQTPIPLATSSVKVYDFDETIANLSQKIEEVEINETSCEKCGSSFDFNPHTFASMCPYCQTPAIIECVQEIPPHALIPFKISRKEARKRFKEWVSSRWFAPNAFKKYLNDNKILQGHYLPHWSYDTDTVSDYQGERGDAYYVTVRKTVVEEGKSREVDVQERRIRWSDASGRVSVDFQEVLVGATPMLSRAILDDLEPWESGELTIFEAQYLSGFEAEEYTIGVKEGFGFAKSKMAGRIESAIRRDIGGDEQRIHHVNTYYNHLKYKNLLFPLWSASFKWNQKEYNYAINAQTGKVVGERPYSAVKIIFTVLSVATLVATVVYFDEIKAYLSTIGVG